MARYIVRDIHIRHGVEKEAREFAPGDLISLSPAEAKLLGKSVEPAEPEKAEKPEKEKK